MILIPIPNSFLRDKPPIVRRLAFGALCAAALALVLVLTGVL